MSIKQLFDTPEEMNYWFSALSRVCSVVSVTTIVTDNEFYALITITLGAISNEIAGFYKLQIAEKKKHKKPDENPS